MDNGATVLDILGGDNYLGLVVAVYPGSQCRKSSSISKRNIGVEAGYHPPVEIP